MKYRLITTATRWLLTGVIVLLSAHPVMANDEVELAKKLAGFFGKTDYANQSK